MYVRHVTVAWNVSSSCVHAAERRPQQLWRLCVDAARLDPRAPIPDELAAPSRGSPIPRRRGHPHCTENGSTVAGRACCSGESNCSICGSGGVPCVPLPVLARFCATTEFRGLELPRPLYAKKFSHALRNKPKYDPRYSITAPTATKAPKRGPGQRHWSRLHPSSNFGRM